MKQVMIIRTDIKMSKGKVAAQCCHGAIGAYQNTDTAKIRSWEAEGSKKVVLKVASVQELFELKEIAKRLNVPNYLVKDAGRTELPASTITCLAIGPDEDEIIDKITQNLKLLG
ncbi:MAG: peptidyl-tRNA hydrolase Pth2 [Methanobacteriaceae archaeon]